MTYEPDKSIALDFGSYKIKIELWYDRLLYGEIDINGNIKSENLYSDEEDYSFNNAIDGIEVLILRHACAGVDIEAPAYKQGIKDTIDIIQPLKEL